MTTLKKQDRQRRAVKLVQERLNLWRLDPETMRQRCCGWQGDAEAKVAIATRELADLKRKGAV